VVADELNGEKTLTARFRSEIIGTDAFHHRAA